MCTCMNIVYKCVHTCLCVYIYIYQYIYIYIYIYPNSAARTLRHHAFNYTCQIASMMSAPFCYTCKLQFVSISSFWVQIYIIWKQLLTNLGIIWAPFSFIWASKGGLGPKLETESFQVRKMGISGALTAPFPPSLFDDFPTMYLNYLILFVSDLHVRFLCDFLWILGPVEE